MNDTQALIAIAIIAAVTALTRFLPFLIFDNGKKTPRLVEKLGRLLPPAVMGMLVVYCLKDVSFTALSGFMPALISCAVTAALYLWRRNTLLAILVGTVCNMLLVQLVF